MGIGKSLVAGAKFASTELGKHYLGEALKSAAKNPRAAANSVFEFCDSAAEQLEIVRNGLGRALQDVADRFDNGGGSTAAAVAAPAVAVAAPAVEIAPAAMDGAADAADEGIDLVKLAGLVVLSAAVGYGCYRGIKWWLGTPEEQEAKKVLDKIADRSTPESRTYTMEAQRAVAEVKNPRLQRELPRLLLAASNHELAKLGGLDKLQ